MDRLYFVMEYANGGEWNISQLILKGVWVSHTKN
jgi:ABC-type transporter MlaC component